MDHTTKLLDAIQRTLKKQKRNAADLARDLGTNPKTKRPYGYQQVYQWVYFRRTRPGRDAYIALRNWLDHA